MTRVTLGLALLLLCAPIAAQADQVAEPVQTAPPGHVTSCFPPLTEYVNRGVDTRILGKAGAVVQNVASWPFRWKRTAPADVKIANQMAAWPPFAALNVPYWRGKWFTLRVGWRYDVNCKRYIADVILKHRERDPLFY